jgi:hypothetical protein
MNQNTKPLHEGVRFACFLLPLLGYILFFVHRKEQKLAADQALGSAVLGSFTFTVMNC